MKKTSFVCLLGALVVVPLSVHAEGGYLGLGLGKSKAKLEDGGFTSVSRKETDTAYKIFAGSQINKYFGAEFGYADPGKLSNVYNVSGTNVTLDGTTHIFYVAATGTLPLGDLSLFVKLGLTSARTSFTAGSGGLGTVSGNDVQSQTMGGAGVGYSFNNKFGVALEYDDFGKVAGPDHFNAKVRMATVSLRYLF